MSPRALVRKVTAWPAAGGVEHDQVRDARKLELLDLAEDEDLPDARDRRRHDLEHPGRDEALGDALEPVVLQVLDEGVVRCDDTTRARCPPPTGS